MGKVLATGPAPPSLATMLGNALGSNFGQGFAPGFQQGHQDAKLAEQFNPVREVLAQKLQGAVNMTPGQALISQITQDPAMFARVMQNPAELQNLHTLNTMAQPQEQAGTGFAHLDELNRTYELYQEARDKGEERRAGILLRRVEDMAGGPIDPDLDLVHWVKPDGTVQSIQSDKRGNHFDLTGEPLALPADARVIESMGLTGGQNDVIGDSEAAQLRTAEAATQNFVDTVGDTLQMLSESPDANTFVGRIAALAGDLKAEAKALGRNMGFEFEDSVLEPETYAESFDDLGISNRRMQSLITALAFQAAAAHNHTGRDVTNRDVERFIVEVGAESADPVAFAQVLQDVAQRAVRGFQNNYKVRRREEFPGDFGLSQLPGFTPPPDEGQGATGVAPGEFPESDEEFLRLLGD